MLPDEMRERSASPSKGLGRWHIRLSVKSPSSVTTVQRGTVQVCGAEADAILEIYYGGNYSEAGISFSIEKIVYSPAASLTGFL